VLPNGLVILVSENHKLPLVSLHGYLLAGQDQNPLDRPGLAALTVRMVDEGTEKYDYLEIAEMVEGAGGSLSILSHREISGVTLQMKSDDLGLGVEILAEMICRPVFPADRLELEKETVLNHLRAAQDDPATVAGDRFDAIIYSGTPLQYPVLGRADSVQGFSAADLKTFHSLRYGPASTIIVVTGGVSTCEVIERIQEHFGSWTKNQPPRAVIPEIKKQERPISEVVEVDKEQVHIMLGHLGVTRTNPDFHALQILDVILGSGPGFTSRIPRRLRDEQGLAYSTYSNISGSSGLYPGRFAAYICTSPEKRETAIQGLTNEIRDLVEHGITEEELETAKDYLTGSFVFDVQSNSLVARFLLTVELFNLGADYLARYPEMIRNVTRADVARVARLYFDTVNYTTVIVGPTINDQEGEG